MQSLLLRNLSFKLYKAVPTPSIFSLVSSPRSGIPVGDLSIGGERGIVVEHNFGAASVSASFYI